MANIKSQIKRNRQNDARRIRNKSVRSALKTSARTLEAAAAAGDQQTVQASLRSTARELDKAASRGVIHKRTAARRKSRLARAAGSLARAAGSASTV